MTLTEKDDDDVVMTQDGAQPSKVPNKRSEKKKRYKQNKKKRMEELKARQNEVCIDL